MRVYVFTVGGFGAFPFKLLAIDEAWPASEADAEAIEYACPTQAPFVRIHLASRKQPTIALWMEKKWPVERIES